MKENPLASASFWRLLSILLKAAVGGSSYRKCFIHFGFFPYLNILSFYRVAFSSFLLIYCLRNADSFPYSQSCGSSGLYAEVLLNQPSGCAE